MKQKRSKQETKKKANIFLKNRFHSLLQKEKDGFLKKILKSRKKRKRRSNLKIK